MAEKDKWSWDEEDKDVEVIEDPKEPAEKGDPKKEDPKEPVEPSFDFGEEKEEEEEEEKGPKDPNIKEDPEEGPEEEEEEKEDDDLSLPGTVKTILEDLVSIGFATAEEVKDVSVDTLYPFIESVAQKKADEIIEESVSSLGERERIATEFLLNGGTLEELVQKSSLKSYTVTTEDGALAFLRDHYTDQGLDDEEVQEQLDYHETNGNAVKVAEKYYSRWKASQEKEVSSDLKAPKANKEDQKAKHSDWKTKVIQGINKVNEYAGIEFTANKKELINDIVMNTVKTDDGKYTSRFISEFFKVYQNDPKKLLLIASILREDFDPAKLATKIETKETTKIKAKIKAASSVGGKPSKGGATRSIMDVLERS